MISASSHIVVERTPAGEMNVLVRSDSDAVTGRFAMTPRRVALAIGLGLISGILISVCLVWYAPELRELAYRMDSPTETVSWSSKSITELEVETRQLQLRVSRLRSKAQKFLPRSSYLVVSTSDNRFELYARAGRVREGICSTGSYVLLKGSDNQHWMFETPRGAFRIQEKRLNPVWAKPDWAFVEEGLPVPPPGAPERYERGVLGDYALAIGDGYLIHGTLYQRLLGQPVTHGCVRLGDDDLEAVFRELSVGSQVFIY